MFYKESDIVEFKKNLNKCITILAYRKLEIESKAIFGYEWHIQTS